MVWLGAKSGEPFSHETDHIQTRSEVIHLEPFTFTRNPGQIIALKAWDVVWPATLGNRVSVC